MGKFFIDRPIFAWVIAIMIMLIGGLALLGLPIAQYPNIASPEIEVSGNYPGASAQTVETTVTQVIEQQMNGLDNLIYMRSTSDATGQFNIRFTFEAGSDVDIAQVQVQNKLQLATPLLPQTVQRMGISVKKSANNYLIVVGFLSKNNSMNGSDIADYISSTLKDPLGRLPGVGDVSLFGSQYAMRVWLDPKKMEQFKLNPSDVANAIKAQNEQVAGGQIGAGPQIKGQQINITINASSRLETKEEFENIFLKVNEDGSTLYLKDVAKVELNEDMFTTIARTNAKPSSALAIKLASGANALETLGAIKKELKDMSQFFPEGLEYVYPLDSEPTIRESILSVVDTLRDAIILVFLIMFLFLQNIRATVIPTITIPVVLLGTFAVLSALGFSINVLTMFGLVLAIGLLVDDAIVVVENVERIIEEEHLSPKEASYKTMDQVTGALVGVAMVICAVFLPMAFMGGSTGVIFRQFSITIVTAMVLSVIIAIILTPALCATMIKHKERKEGEKKSLPAKFFGAFNTWFANVTNVVTSKVRNGVYKPKYWLIVFVFIITGIGFLFTKTPTGFLPDEDQSQLFVSVQLPASASFERTSAILKRIEEYVLKEEKENINCLLTVSGSSLGVVGQNLGLVMLSLRNWEERPLESQKVFAIKDRIFKKFANTPEALVFAFVPPAVQELGDATGFDFELVDMAGIGHEKLMKARNKLLALANSHKNLSMVRANGLDDAEQYQLDIDVKKAGAQSLTKDVITSAISSYWGSEYVNDFTDRGRTKKVYIQSESAYRSQISDLERYYIRNAKGEMVPVNTFVKARPVYGSPMLERYAGVSSIEILGEPSEGKSSGEAMRAMESFMKKMPKGLGYKWTGLSYQELLSGNQAVYLYALSVIVVLLCLAALYESWTVPFAIVAVIPAGVLGAIAGVYVNGMSNDVYFQIGLLTVMGLSAKNSILIVEFAKDLYEKGEDLFEAAIHAVKLRFRPVLMTSLCFILGVLPLVTSNGAGSGGQNVIGTTVVCGVLVATSLGIFFTPIFFVILVSFFAKGKKNKEVSVD